MKKEKTPIICQSGEIGMRKKVHEIYDDYEDFLHYNSMFNIVERLGYPSPKTLWEENPMIEGSSNPKDFRVVPKPLN